MIETQKPRVYVELDVPKLNSRTENVILRPEVIEAKWSKNSYLEADALTITISWKEGGVDPRWLRNARCAMWMWDEAFEPFDKEKHLRFTGICVKADRKVSEESSVVSLTFHDYASLFISMRPFPTRGMPEWSDTLETIWQKVCDNTGYYEPGSNSIVSSVTALRDKLTFSPQVLKKYPNIRSLTLGSTVPPRFHDVGRPTPKSRTDAWAVWNYCLTALGFIGYIDKDTCVVIDGPTIDDEAAPGFLYGHNISEFSEEVNSDISVKGVVVQSFNPLTGQTLEAFYPPPGDERIKVARAKANRADKEGRGVSANDTSSEWVPHAAHGVVDPEKLQRLAELIYDQQHRQEIQGTLKTSVMRLDSKDNLPVDILSLKSGDPITVGVSKYQRDTLLKFGSMSERVRYLVDSCGYDADVAELIALNLDVSNFASQIFHVVALEVELGAETFSVEIKYQSTLSFADDV